MAGDELTEEDFKKIAKKSNGNSASPYSSQIDPTSKKSVFGYDEHTVEVMDFEFISVDCMYFEEKENKYGNSNFFYEGYSYKDKPGSVFERKASKMEVATLYSGKYILGTDYIINYGH